MKKLLLSIMALSFVMVGSCFGGEIIRVNGGGHGDAVKLSTNSHFSINCPSC